MDELLFKGMKDKHIYIYKTFKGIYQHDDKKEKTRTIRHKPPILWIQFEGMDKF